jgi:hypothetical protein
MAINELNAIEAARLADNLECHALSPYLHANGWQAPQVLDGLGYERAPHLAVPPHRVAAGPSEGVPPVTLPRSDSVYRRGSAKIATTSPYCLPSRVLMSGLPFAALPPAATATYCTPSTE